MANKGAANFQQVNTNDRVLQQVQDNIQRALHPVISNPQNFGATLTSISLVTGTNTVSHGLNRTLQGWTIVRQRAAATVYDTQDSNATPDKTLVLVASAPVTVDLYVY